MKNSTKVYKLTSLDCKSVFTQSEHFTVQYKPGEWVDCPKVGETKAPVFVFDSKERMIGFSNKYLDSSRRFLFWECEAEGCKETPAVIASFENVLLRFYEGRVEGDYASLTAERIKLTKQLYATDCTRR